MKKGYSLVEIMVVLAALAGVALVVTKIGQNSQIIQNEAVVMNDYNELVREAHFLMGNPASCKISLEGTTFSTTDYNKEVTAVELWQADSRGMARKKKMISKNEKYKGITIDDITLKIDEPNLNSFPDGALIRTTASLKVLVGKSKFKNQQSDIEHNFNLNFFYNASKKEGVIADCGLNPTDDKQANVWCGHIVNPCGSESAEVVGIGKYQNGKFTGIFEPLRETSEKFCLAAKNHDASFRRCE